MNRMWVQQSAWGWVVKRGFDNYSPQQLAGPFTTEEAAEAWRAGWDAGRAEVLEEYELLEGESL